MIRAACLCLQKAGTLWCVLRLALFQGHEPPRRRAKAIFHIFLGVYLAVLLRSTSVEHIHVHHGYFSCWIAMAAARFLGITYSVTLHGSDLMLHKAYLETKLANCQFCTTVSEFNRRYILEHYPSISPTKIFVRRMGVDPGQMASQKEHQSPLIILSVGRLHPVKNHAFLINACARLKQRRCSFASLIAGEGKERHRLELLIRSLDMEHQVILLGHLSPSQLERYYANSSLVVLTSRSEGLPLTLMEAMTRGKIVLAPAITGIPELVRDGETGFLFREGSTDDFIEKVEKIRSSSPEFLNGIRSSARQLILEQFDRETNLASFTDLLVKQTTLAEEINPHENFVLQQI
ncbi:MAG TPA: glycosyltransferase family 4 protein [Terriglobales bacterium]|nr:glycosyltransferase family 4 protein [Terriglobales bacterium]